MKTIISVILILLHIHLIGCVSVQAVDREYLKYDESKPLRIEMNDGSRIRLSPGNYHVKKDGDSLSIIGHGIRYDSSKGKDQQPFAGSIRSGEIRTIEIVEPGASVYLLPIYIGAVTAIGLIILLSFHGSSVGG